MERIVVNYDVTGCIVIINAGKERQSARILTAPKISTEGEGVVATRYRDSPRNERGGASTCVYTRTHEEHPATRAPRQRKPESSRSPTQCVSPGTRLSEITTLHTCPYRAVQEPGEPPPGTRNLLQRLLTRDA